MPYGSGKYTYELARWQAKFPDNWQPTEVNGLAIDKQDRIYAFNTGEYPVTVFDREGNLLNTWKNDIFTHTHGAAVGPDGSVYYADDGNHTVSKFTPEGRLLMTLGKKGQPSDTGFTYEGEGGKKLNFFEALATVKRGGPPFNSPTGVAVTPKGEIYVSDGYGNAAVHKFSAEGKLLFTWGEPGKGPGQFFVPHSIAIDKNGQVLVADRHNNRVQVFDAKGKFITEWPGLNFPTSIFIAKDQTVYVSELMQPGIAVFNADGKLITRWGNEGRTKEDPLFVALHSIVVDSKGDIYVAEVMGVQKDTPFFTTRKTRMIQKFTRKT
jgi:DNA-binding beta-propeller fold protein YncE